MSLHKHSQRTVRKACNACGSKDLYWAHDTERPGMACPSADKCANPGIAGRFTLINTDGTRHECRNRATGGDGEAMPQPEADPSPASPSVTPSGAAQSWAPQAGQDKLAVAAQLLEALSPKVDAAEVKRLIAEQHDEHSSALLAKVDAKIEQVSAPVKLEITQPDGTAKVVDGAHKVLPTVVKIVGNARKHCLMVGPAGTGKSTIAEQVAEALSLPYFSISLSPQTPASALLGYMQAAGEYVKSLYREAFEHGGVFHFDEFDNAHPSVLAVINASLANGHMAFPDKMVKRHPEFRVCASANTYGRGPDRQYVGRQAIDAATLDRFVVVPVDVDEALEAKICHASGASAHVVSEVLKYVRTLRKAADRDKMALIFSPRASEGMCSLITAGLSVHEAIEMRVRRGISDADWSKVTRDAGLPHI